MFVEYLIRLTYYHINPNFLRFLKNEWFHQMIFTHLLKWSYAFSVNSVTQSRLTLCNPIDCRMPGFPVHHQLLEPTQLMSIVLVMPSNHLILCHPFLLLPSVFPSIRGFFQWVSFSHQVTKYWNFSFSISPSNEYLGLIFFRIDWFDLLAVQGTLKSLLQHHSSKAFSTEKKKHGKL